MKFHTLYHICLAVLVIFSGCQHRFSGVLGRVRGIDGLTEQQLIATLGKPFRREEFLASASVGEFRTGIERIRTRLQNEDVLVRELTWDRVDYLITAWLYETDGNWIAFDSLKYEKGVKF